MSLDPSTLCARTAAGDAELAAPRHGLAIALRRLLSILDHPVPLDELVQRPGVLADRVEKDLLRLAEHGLVELHGPSVPAGSAAGRPPAKAAAGPFVPASRPASPASRPASPASRPASPASRPASPVSVPAPALPRQDAPRPWIDAHPGLAASAGPAAPESRIVLGKRVRHGRALVLGFLTLLAVGAVVWWLSAPAHDAPAPVVVVPPASVPAPARRAEATPEPSPASVPEPVRVVATPESFVTNPAPAAAPSPPSAVPHPPPAVPAPTAAPADVAAAARSSPLGPQARTPAPSKPEPVATLPEPGPVAAPASTPGAAAAAQPTSPDPAVPPAPAVSPPSAPPPVRLAAATPSTLASQPAARKLVPITREEPAFPRDALAQGVTKGTVRARVAIDASGKVTAVEIVDAQPRRVFDRAVQRALGRWTYEPGEPARSADVEVSFERD